MDSEYILFIAGAPKTATSTMVGILNCHPDIFIFFESWLFRGEPSKYAMHFLGDYPDARHIIRYHDDISAPYKETRSFLSGKGYNFNIVGDKIATIDHNLIGKLNNHKVIFTIRDIRTWLRKDSIINIYQTKNNIIPTTIDYLTFVLQSFLLSDVLHVRTESIVQDNLGTIKKIGDFLKIDLSSSSERWWEKLDTFEKDNPKYSQGWWTGHISSSVKPKKMDIEVKLNSHIFWDTLLPIFDKYYKNIDKNFDEYEIRHDIAEIKKLKKLPPTNLKAIYKDYRTNIIIPKQKRKSMNEKVKYVIRQLINKLYRKTIKLFS